MIYKVLENCQIWIQFILIENSAEEKFRYSSVLSKYGKFKYIEEDIIEFTTDCFDSAPNREQARSFVEKLNGELNIQDLIHR